MDWSKEWPILPGFYWFYGWPFGIDKYDPELHFVKVIYDSLKKPIYITNGHFLYKSEGACGIWKIAELPELPIR